MPIWLQTNPPFMVRNHASGARCIAHALKFHRPFYKYVARLGFVCLADFYLPNGNWPNAEELDIMLWPDPDAIVQDWPINVQLLHSLLTTVLRQVHGAFGVFCNYVRPANRRPRPHFAHQPHDPRQEVVPFASTTDQHLQRLAWHPPVLPRRHPLHREPHLVTTEQLTRHVKAVRKLLQLPAPIYGDVWLRLLFKMLPVQSRFPFLQDTQPRIMECTYRPCHLIETERHAFRDCPCVRGIWTFHETVWRVVGVTFTWECIESLSFTTFVVDERHAAVKDHLFHLWVMLTAVILHMVWTHRNKARFETYREPPRHAWQEQSTLTWATSVRRHLRLLHDDIVRRDALIQLMHELLEHPLYRSIHQQHPTLLQLHPDER
ncbi:hypothetical protein H310_09742 [Aphanomyces invadans]|uniref:Uncharacterized protein n=2 Tax=Aphanomyces invadans TaxID=157072 RepID=A0A024TVS5_9STRA|nr:hypothetical protein H310_09742 [Aphanomyces invadans]ETV97412.1 hypothetical protein H310_09742 [Aphanomyces invadans]|eukprot:XP_008874120.1 hypothetical protein H310_09742 [Aphanomyces invadans]